ncbi:nitroreductase family protein [Chloroflexota bacterium]
MEVLEAIKSRRSIRRYKTTPVDDKTIELVLEAAQWAPSWANTQCWRFIVVRDTSIKDKLADTLKSARPDGKNAATEAVRNAPVVVVACAELKKAGYYQGEPTTDKGDWYMFDVALAMQNLVLAAHSAGLGTVYVGLFDAEKVAAILSVPQGFCVVSLTPLAYPDEEPAPRPRKELSEIVFYDKYGA